MESDGMSKVYVCELGLLSIRQVFPTEEGHIQDSAWIRLNADYTCIRVSDSDLDHIGMNFGQAVPAVVVMARSGCRFLISSSEWNWGDDYSLLAKLLESRVLSAGLTIIVDDHIY